MLRAAPDEPSELVVAESAAARLACVGEAGRVATCVGLSVLRASQVQIPCALRDSPCLGRCCRSWRAPCPPSGARWGSCPAAAGCSC